MKTGQLNPYETPEIMKRKKKGNNRPNLTEQKNYMKRPILVHTHTIKRYMSIYDQKSKTTCSE